MGREGALVVDVTVRYNSKGSLENASKKKCEKYQPPADDLVAWELSRTCEVLPIVIGSRGAIPRNTLKSLTTRIMSKRLTQYLAMCALGFSVEIYT